MLSGGDELGRTQQGNNNAYCQDNELSWYDWDDSDLHLLDFTRRLSMLRREHPVFRRRRWFQGRPLRGSDVTDVAWFTPDGSEMSEDDWNQGFAKSIGVWLNGSAIPDPDERGERVTDDDFLLLFNAHHEDLAFTIPESRWGDLWVIDFDTAEPLVLEPERTHKSGSTLIAAARSVMVLRRIG